MKPTDPGTAGERRLKGLAVSPGLAIGVASIPDARLPSVPDYLVEPGGEPAEIARFEHAVGQARDQLVRLRDRSDASHGQAAAEIGPLLDAHIAMLTGSRLMRGVVERIRATRQNAEAAVRLEIDALADSFAALDDPYIAARIEDVRMIGHRLLRNLVKAPTEGRAAPVPERTILLADELSPADAALIDPRSVVGFATVTGGAESHTAIMARALGLPAVLACPGLLDAAQNGDTVILDGYEGTVTIAPSPETLVAFERESGRLALERERLKSVVRLPAATRDGIKVSLQANLELPREIEAALESGADGIGLLRTEFLYLNRSGPPDEDEQFVVLADIVRRMGGREVTIRTLDVGGDKLPFPIPGAGAGPNPAMGLRAIRLGLHAPALLDAQLRAILRVAAIGPVRILLPMVSSLAQVRAVRDRLSAAGRALGLDAKTAAPPLGVMIEVPGAALAADAFARESDFFAIGTNDLTQYTLAIDRGDEQVAALYNPLHPAVLRLIQFTCEAAKRADIPVSVCGEIAGNPRLTPLLVGLGLRSLSMAPARLPLVKERLRALSLTEALMIAGRVMRENDEGAIAASLDPIAAVLPSAC